MFEREFEAMLSRYKDAISDKKRFTGLIKDFFPSDLKTVNTLLMAYDLGIAQEIKDSSNITNVLAYKYVKQLVDNYGLSRVNADWIVSIWCVCYGQKVLKKPCDIAIQEKGKAAVSDSPNSQSGINYEDLFEIERSTDGTGYFVKGFRGFNRKTIVVPNRIHNHKIVGISEECFSETDKNIGDRRENLGINNIDNVEEVVLAEGITSIENKSFAGCSELHQVIIPITVRKIGAEAFSYCAKLRALTLTDGIEELDDRCFAYSAISRINIPKSVCFFGDYLFTGCEYLESIVIPKNMTRIPKGTFESCPILKQVTLPDTLETIEDRAFAYCKDLDFIIIPDSVKYIGDDAFIETNKRFIIQCSFGSYAEEYARKKKIKYQLV